MPVKSPNTNASAEIWARVIQFKKDLSPALARALLNLQFSPDDMGRMRELAAKARSGNMTDSEQLAIDTYERLGCLLDIIHSKARVALKRGKSRT